MNARRITSIWLVCIGLFMTGRWAPAVIGDACRVKSVELQVRRPARTLSVVVRDFTDADPYALGHMTDRLGYSHDY